MHKTIWLAIVGICLAGAITLRHLFAPAALSAEERSAIWSQPLPRPTGPVATYHLGHSLVGRDMPALFAQMAGHSFASQLGWGASLRDHWTGDVPGFKEENAHPAHQGARDAMSSGQYGAFVLTEMVELRDAIRYHDSAAHLAKWMQSIRDANPKATVFLYETWHRLDDPQGWENRIDQDLQLLWEDQVMAPAMAAKGAGPLYLIPGGQVMAAAASAIEAGQVPGLTARADLFSKNADGTVDTIHFNATGAYLIALTHFAVIYQTDPAKAPATQPANLRLADGAPLAIPDQTASALQSIVWQTVQRYPQTGLPRSVKPLD